MPALVASLPTLGVATVYCFWAVYQRTQHQRERLLRERVSYLVWVVAHSGD